MPEIAEAARLVHYIRKHLVGKALTKVTTLDDSITCCKFGTSGAFSEKRMAGKTVVDAGQQGKYFWMIMSRPPGGATHFGINGWLKISSEHYTSSVSMSVFAAICAICGLLRSRK